MFDNVEIMISPEIKADEEYKRGLENMIIPGTECTVPGKSSGDECLAPLKIAAGRVAELVCEFSYDAQLFVSDPDSSDSGKKKLDTKTLKEFTSVIKELGTVIRELYGIQDESKTDDPGVLIEFSPGTDEYAG